jgi:hypothetical protein
MGCSRRSYEPFASMQMDVHSIGVLDRVASQTPPLLNWVLVVGAVLLTYGTWLVGTSGGSV